MIINDSAGTSTGEAGSPVATGNGGAPYNVAFINNATINGEMANNTAKKWIYKPTNEESMWVDHFEKGFLGSFVAVLSLSEGITGKSTAEILEIKVCNAHFPLLCCWSKSLH